jgi:hypothetical protein
MSGQVQVMFDTISSSFAHIKAGKLRALAMTSVTRSDVLPDVPMIADTVPGYLLTRRDRTGRLTMQSAANQSPQPNSLLTGKLTGNFADWEIALRVWLPVNQQLQWLADKFPTQRNREFF